MSEKPTISDTDYGFNGLLRIFNEQEIDITEWVFERLDKERGGISFNLPMCSGEIYLTWGDLYRADIQFVRSQKKYDEVLQLGQLYEIIKELENTRLDFKKSLSEMLKNAFKIEEE